MAGLTHGVPVWIFLSAAVRDECPPSASSGHCEDRARTVAIGPLLPFNRLLRASSLAREAVVHDELQPADLRRALKAVEGRRGHDTELSETVSRVVLLTCPMSMPGIVKLMLYRYLA